MKPLRELILDKQNEFLLKMNEAAARAIIKARLKGYDDSYEFELCEERCSKCTASKPVGSQIVTSATIDPPLSTESERVGCMWKETKVSPEAIIQWARLECPRFLSEFFWRVDEDTLSELLEL